MNNRTKILYIIDSLNAWAGTEKHLYKLISGMNKERYDCHVCAFAVTEDMRNRFNTIGVDILHLPIKNVYGLMTLKQGFRLARYMREQEIDIVQTFHFAADFLGTLIAKLAGVPVVISSKRDMGFLNNNMQARALRLLAPLVNRTICVSNAVKKGLAARQVVDPKKAVVFYNGVDLDEFKVDHRNIASRKQQLGLRPELPVIALVANPRPIKDLETFIRAGREVLDRKHEAQFIIVGAECFHLARGSYQTQLDALVAKLDLQERVIFLGNRPDVNRILPLADICVLTSLSEGFSNTIVEYMTAGRPVIATDVGGNSEAIVENETGFLVPVQAPERLAELTVKLLNDKALAARLGRAGRKRIEKHFTLGHMVENHQALYNALLSGSGRGRNPASASSRNRHFRNAVKTSN